MVEQIALDDNVCNITVLCFGMEREMVVWRLEDQDTELLLRNMQKLDVDRCQGS